MTAATVLDIVVVLTLLGYAVRGWRTGVLGGGLGLLGLVAGAALALWGAPRSIAHVAILNSSAPLRAVVLIVAVLVAALVGQGLLGALGRRLRSATPLPWLRIVDSLFGLVGAVVVAALVIWFIGAAVRPVVPRSWARTMNDSTALTTIDRATPDQVGRYASRLTEILDGSGMPRVFSGLFPETIAPAPRPDNSVGQTAKVRKAAASIVKIRTVAESCGRAQEGSGWVSARHRVVTNAHVVAGASAVSVQPGGEGPRLTATVVAFDPDLDMAVLEVPDLGAPPLPRTAALERATGVVVAGFPQDGPYRVTPARVRGVLYAPGDDIYGGGGVTREVYSLYAAVQPGNSGGPVLTKDGRVAGTVFARSLVDAETGYALTNAETETTMDEAAHDMTPASTQRCISDK
jgi:S1-C subfamily serine protease